jgi:voltage-gated potassium channel
MWWAIVTVTTVGYGDVVPITPLGKVFGSILGFVGVAMVALPAGILASGFSDALNRRRNSLRHDRDRAMRDGVVDAAERRELEARGESLSLSDDQVAEILAGGAETPLVHAGLCCPHCGKPLDKAVPPA